MKTFPIHALSRGYTLGTPKRRITDSGVTALQLGNGVLRARAELGQAIVAYDLHFTALPWSDVAVIEAFYKIHRRGVTPFWRPDPQTYHTYAERFDPTAPPQFTPSTNVPGAYDVSITTLPVVPTIAENMLVAHWKCNDNAADTTVADATGNGHDGTASENTEDLSSTGKINAGLAFVGASEHHVTISDRNDLDLVDGGTVCFWARATGGTVEGLVTKGFGWAVYQGSGVIRSYTNAGVNHYSLANQALSTSWMHVAALFGPYSRKIFINGQDATVTEGTPASVNATTTNVSLGLWGISSPYTYSDVVLDDVRIYKRPLTPAEIRAIYNGGSGTEEVIVP